MLAHRSVHWSRPTVVSEVGCRLEAVLPLGMASCNAAFDSAGAGAPGLGVLGQCRGDWGRRAAMGFHVNQQCCVLVSHGRRVKARGLVPRSIGVLGGEGSALNPLVGSRRAGLLR